MSAPAVLGIDGGGSKTALAVADARGDLLAFETGPGLDPLHHPDWPERLAALLGRVAPLLPSLRGAAMGISGHGEVDAISRRQTEVACRSVSVPCAVLNDVELAFDGAFAGAPGVLVLAGTGSMVWARDDAGRDFRVGGWGSLFGDEGSAFWVGREALAAASRALDNRSQHGDFARDLLARLHVGAEGLLAWCLGLADQRGGIAAVATTVDAMADHGDPVAVSILTRAADQLCLHVEAVRRTAPSCGDAPWSYAGGLFASATLGLRMASRIGAPRAPSLPPVGGALLRAARRLGWPADATWVARLGASLRNGS